ncbi:hypothetical protein PR048_019585 [Dryococelus australis]|uniref:Uncharacterized protein n=1 Tax=Dryococelus australis TaxID=614101 RepID=A0ABQ9H3Z7_9NEOP|nr:hypothetical protein PR048_019585 [Dryococelus australis]
MHFSFKASAGHVRLNVTFLLVRKEGHVYCDPLLDPPMGKSPYVQAVSQVLQGVTVIRPSLPLKKEGTGFDVSQRYAIQAGRDGAGMRGAGKREIAEKTRRPTASSGTIPTCENPCEVETGSIEEGGTEHCMSQRDTISREFRSATNSAADTKNVCHELRAVKGNAQEPTREPHISPDRLRVVIGKEYQFGDVNCLFKHLISLPPNPPPPPEHNPIEHICDEMELRLQCQNQNSLQCCRKNGRPLVTRERLQNQVYGYVRLLLINGVTADTLLTLLVYKFRNSLVRQSAFPELIYSTPSKFSQLLLVETVRISSTTLGTRLRLREVHKTDMPTAITALPNQLPYGRWLVAADEKNELSSSIQETVHTVGTATENMSISAYTEPEEFGDHCAFINCAIDGADRYAVVQLPLTCRYIKQNEKRQEHKECQRKRAFVVAGERKKKGGGGSEKYGSLALWQTKNEITPSIKVCAEDNGICGSGKPKWALLFRVSVTIFWQTPPTISHQGDQGPILGRATPDFRVWESCRTMPLVDGFSRGFPPSKYHHSLTHSTHGARRGPITVNYVIAHTWWGDKCGLDHEDQRRHNRRLDSRRRSQGSRLIFCMAKEYTACKQVHLNQGFRKFPVLRSTDICQVHTRPSECQIVWLATPQDILPQLLSPMMMLFTAAQTKTGIGAWDWWLPRGGTIVKTKYYITSRPNVISLALLRLFTIK